MPLVPVFQCPVSNDPHGQHRGPAHPGAHSAVWIWEVSLQGPFFQDAQPVPVHLHERFHRYRTKRAKRSAYSHMWKMNPVSSWLKSQSEFYVFNPCTVNQRCLVLCCIYIMCSYLDLLWVCLSTSTVPTWTHTWLIKLIKQSLFY